MFILVMYIFQRSVVAKNHITPKHKRHRLRKLTITRRYSNVIGHVNVTYFVYQ